MKRDTAALMERLKAIDPIDPVRLQEAVRTPEARATLQRILESSPAPVGTGARARARDVLAPPPRRWLTRPILVAAAVTALAVLAATIVATLPRPRTASAQSIVQEAIAEVATLPPFQATVSYERVPTEGLEATGKGLYTFAYESRSRWRAAVLEREGDDNGPGNFVTELTSSRFQVPPMTVGSFIVSDGDRVGVYVADLNQFFSRAFEPELDLRGSALAQLAWEEAFVGNRSGAVPTPIEGGPSASVTWKSRCADSEVFPDTSIAGRPARHVRCGDWTLWIDAENGLVLKVETSFYTVEIRDIEYSPAFRPGTFEVKVPEGACDRGNADQPKPCFLVGEPTPSWTGPLLGGGTFDSRSLLGKPSAVYSWANWCDPCVGERVEEFQAAYRDRGQEINFVSIALTSADEAQAFLDQGGYDFPVVIDEDSRIIDKTLGVPGIPALLLLDAEGRAVALYLGALPEDLDRLLDALVAGGPLPVSTDAGSDGG